MDFHHPLFQGLALPLCIAFVATGLLRGGLGPARGARWAAAGVAVAIVGTASWMLGWRLLPGTLTEKLPWIYAAAALVGLGLEALRASRRTQWVAAGVLWALVLASLPRQPLPLAIGIWLLGMVVIRTVLKEGPRRADAVAMLVVASLGLAALAMMSGSALLFELSLALGAALAGGALWLWPVARIAFGASAAVVSVLAWLTLMQATALLTPARPAALLLLVAAFSSGSLVRRASRHLRRGEARPWVESLIVAAVAALWVAAALALAHWGAADTPANMDDPYYQPKW
ncbi:hypothetical protein J7E62_13720 [Variovorax paradoxus]|nr:hypothetical protein [Variovorax paradoxus]